jgi:hypothetical protein
MQEHWLDDCFNEGASEYKHTVPVLPSLAVVAPARFPMQT